MHRASPPNTHNRTRTHKHTHTTPPLVEILVVLPDLSGGRESTSPLGYSWGALATHTHTHMHKTTHTKKKNKHEPMRARACTDTSRILMREGGSAAKATAE